MPSPSPSRCRRFRADGTACPNLTTRPDGWCREDDCPGYVRSDLLTEHVTSGGPFGSPGQVAASAHLAAPVDVDEVDDIRISQRARDSFRFHHQGDDAAAETQLRWMLEDFITHSARSRTRGGLPTLSREGFTLILSPDGATVTGYATVHAERTWEQVKAGVKSRYGRGSANGRQATAEAPEPGPRLPPEQVAGRLDPATVHLTARVRRSYDQRRVQPARRDAGLPRASDAELDAALRADLAAQLPGARIGDRCDDVMLELVTDQLVWLVTRDAASVVGVRERRPDDGT